MRKCLNVHSGAIDGRQNVRERGRSVCVRGEATHAKRNFLQARRVFSTSLSLSLSFPLVRYVSLSLSSPLSVRYLCVSVWTARENKATGVGCGDSYTTLTGLLAWWLKPKNEYYRFIIQQLCGKVCKTAFSLPNVMLRNGSTSLWWVSLLQKT